MQSFLTMGDDYQNEDYHREKNVEESSHTSEACSEFRKTGSLPVSVEETQENYEYIPDPDMLMRKLPKNGPKTKQGLFASGIGKLKEWCRSPINIAYGLAFLSLIMAIAALRLAVHRCFPSCPHEWIMFQEECYYYDQNQANWINARGTCHDLGADFVVIDSEEEQDFLVYNIPTKGTYWIGYNDIEDKKNETGVDGSVYTNWALPKDQHEGSCIVFKGPMYKWHKTQCSSNYPFICEKRTRLACVRHFLHSSFN